MNGTETLEPTTEVAEEASSEYASSTSFEELSLSEGTRAGIAARGYTQPTPVQAAVVAPILAGRDVIVRSKTGTGKTAAFGIPLVELCDPSLNAVQALVLCNTRELALQIAQEITALGEPKGVKVAAIYGGASMDAQVRALEGGASIAVGTPGRVMDLIQRKILKLDKTRIGVLDEADEMLGMGFYEDVISILNRLPRGHQTLLFSATVSPDIESIIRTHLKDPETILISADTYTVEGIDNVIYYAQDAYPKPRNLLYMLQLENPETAIIFCNTRDDVNLVTTVLDRAGFDADKLSGELPQKERERVMARVKRGEVRFMVATDIAARGIDISDLTHVINYSLPEDPSVYLHRVGRTGRIGKTGTALSLVRGPELVTLATLEKRFGIKFQERKLPTPEEARKMWTDSHISELRSAVGSLVFDAYIPLAQDLKNRDGGEVLIAFALKYFFTHHRMEKAAATRGDEERKSLNAHHEEQKDRLKERRSERAKPKLEKGEVRTRERTLKPAEEKEAAAEAPPPEKQEGPRNRLFVSVGTDHGVDEEAVRNALVELSGAPAEAIQKLDVKAGCSFVEVAPEQVDAFLTANGKALGDKNLTVEIARRPTRRRRR